MIDNSKRILCLSTTDYGGAGRAAVRTVHALSAAGVNVELKVAHSKTDLPIYSLSENSRIEYIRFRLIEKLQKFIGNSIYKDEEGLSNINIMSPCNIRYNNADVTMLFWICNFVSLQNISKIRNKLVWRFSDLWPITSGAHYDHRLIKLNNWHKYYNLLNKPEKLYLKWKLSNYPEDIKIICPSRWIFNLVVESKIFDHKNIYHIPTGIETSIFTPIPKVVARICLGISQEKKVIVVGSVGGDNDPRKGFNNIREVLEYLRCKDKSIVVVGFGKKALKDKLIDWIGDVNSDLFMRMLFSASDLYVHGAKIDNFPQTILEAQSCGCPVIAYNSTGVGECLKDNISGFLVDENKSYIDYKSIIIDYLNSERKISEFAQNARDFIVENYNQNLYVRELLKVIF